MLLWYASCTFVKKDDHHDSRYRISVKEFQKLAGISTNNFSDFKDTIRSIQSKGIEVEDNETWSYYNYFSSPKYLKNKGVFEFGFLPEIHEKLKKRSNGSDGEFTIIEINEITNLKTKYGAKMFAELKSIKNQREKSITMTIEEFKLKFGLNKKKSYNRFNNIRQKVLEPMKKDLDENATLSFNLKRHQEGNSITALTFELIDNIKAIQNKIVAKDKDISDTESSLTYYKNADRLSHWGISTNKTKELLDNLNDEKVSLIIDEVSDMISSKEIPVTQAAGTLINKINDMKISSKIEFVDSENYIKLKTESDNHISKNSTYWKAYQFNYQSLSSSAHGVIKKNGDEIMFSNPDFINIIKPFLRDNESEVTDKIKQQLNWESIAERRGEGSTDRRVNTYKIIKGLRGTSEKRHSYGKRKKDDKV